MKINQFSHVLTDCKDSDISLARYFLQREIQTSPMDETSILAKMEDNLKVTEKAVADDKAGVRSLSGLTGLDGSRILDYMAL